MLTMLLQAAVPAAPAASAAQNGQMGGGWSLWVMIILLFAVMYFFMIRPQRKQQKELEEMRNALKKGDRVITAGGIYGVIADIDERTVLIKVDGDVKLRVDKSSIQKDTTASAAATPAEKKEDKK